MLRGWWVLVFIESDAFITRINYDSNTTNIKIFCFTLIRKEQFMFYPHSLKYGARRFQPFYVEDLLKRLAHASLGQPYTSDRLIYNSYLDLRHNAVRPFRPRFTDYKLYLPTVGLCKKLLIIIAIIFLWPVLLGLIIWILNTSTISDSKRSVL